MPETARRLTTTDDLFRLRLVADPQLSPAGDRIVYAVTRTDLEKNRYFSNLWMVGAEAGEARPFTHGDQRDGQPRWSPDGNRIAFVSYRGEKAQIWRIAADGGEAQPLTTLEDGAIGELHWSPDGGRIAFTYRPKPEWARNSAKEEREKNHRSMPPLHVRRLHYRTEGEGTIGDERWHVFVLDVDSGAATQLTSGESDQGSLAWSPDGREIAFVTNRTSDPDRTPQFEEIRIVPAGYPPQVGRGGEERLVAAPQGPKGALAWSPGGETIAYFGHTDVEDVWSPTDSHLWVVPATGGEGRELSASLDRHVGDATLGDLRAFGGGWAGPTWSPDGASLFFLASDRGACHVYRMALGGGPPENLTPGLAAEVASLSLDAAGRRIAAVVGDPLQPGDVHVGEVGGRRMEFAPRTAMNRELLAELELAAPEEFSAASDGGEVHGWLLRPPAGVARSGAGTPLILYIHGGPHTQYGWAMMHEFQLLAARGFSILYTNPRGSRGYGQRHVAAIRGDWGGPDYGDLMAATDAAARLPGIDPERVGVTGGSYGGFMTNWIVGHTDRFRCAVTQRSVVNLQSMAGTCDFNFGDTKYFGGNAWNQPERLLAQSPLTYAAAVGTPLLILHSEGDLRCPIEQAEQLFAALKNLGGTVEFVRYPREANHGLSRSGPPDLRRDRLERIASWMERWLLA